MNLAQLLHNQKAPDRQTNKQINKQTNKQTKIPTNISSNTYTYTQITANVCQYASKPLQGALHTYTYIYIYVYIYVYIYAFGYESLCMSHCGMSHIPQGHD